MIASISHDRQRSEPIACGIGTYRLKTARTWAEIEAAQRLRFEVFNLELNEGLSESFRTGLDADRFDAVCDHLLVEDVRTGAVVGTYRMQLGSNAARNHGYYCSREFDFAPYEPIRKSIVELGRACIHKDHRNFSVLSLLWRGIVAYAHQHGARFLLGCSSLTSQDAAVGATAYVQLERRLAEPAYRTVPQAGYACPLDRTTSRPPETPKLLAAYLALGASICGPPAIDEAFRTIDFLTLMDLDSPTMQLRRRRFGISLA